MVTIYLTSRKRLKMIDTQLNGYDSAPFEEQSKRYKDHASQSDIGDIDFDDSHNHVVLYLR